MIEPITNLLCVSDAWCSATGKAEATLSTRMLRDGKRLGRIRAGADIGVLTIAAAMRWLSDHWPDGLDWPADVPRPCGVTEEKAA